MERFETCLPGVWELRPKVFDDRKYLNLAAVAGKFPPRMP
jgi:hypothetical protein